MVFENPSWVAPHLAHAYPPQAMPEAQRIQQEALQQQARPQHQTRARKQSEAIPWYCEDCGRQTADVFEAGQHESVTGHTRCREMTEREYLSFLQVQKKAELMELRRNAQESSQAAGGPVGHQSLQEEQNLSASKIGAPFRIPGLGPLPPTNRGQSGESELERLRRENESLKAQVKSLKYEVRPRIMALEAELADTKAEMESRCGMTPVQSHELAEIDDVSGMNGDMDMDFVS